MLIGAGTRPLPAPNPTPTPREGLAGPVAVPDYCRIRAISQVSTTSRPWRFAVRSGNDFEPGGTESNHGTEESERITTHGHAASYVGSSSDSPTDSADEANIHHVVVSV